MGGGHHHNERLPIPDYRTYHVGDHTPRLQKIERMLAAKGLKDPWIRNEVWRYDEVMNGSPKIKILRTMGFGGRGFIIGFPSPQAMIMNRWDPASIDRSMDHPLSISSVFRLNFEFRIRWDPATGFEPPSSRSKISIAERSPPVRPLDHFDPVVCPKMFNNLDNTAQKLVCSKINKFRK